MPIYKYACAKCDSHVEVIQKLNDAPLKRCKQCGGKLKKAVSRTSFQLKGSGWYASDYQRKDSAKSKDPVETGADKKTESVSKITASGDKD